MGTTTLSLPQQGEMTMNVTIKNMTARRLAVLEHRGDPNRVGDSVNKLINWAKAQPINLKPLTTIEILHAMKENISVSF